jgi:putative transposase
VTDITYIRTMEGFAYLAVVLDLYSRRVVGWSLQSRQTTDVVLQALHMAVWRRKTKTRVLTYSNWGSQFTSIDWSAFTKVHNLEHSMSRRGNCHDNAVAESFFNLFKRERIRRRTYKRVKKPGRMCSITSRCFTTRSASTSGTGCCRLSSSNGTGFDGSRRLGN